MNDVGGADPDRRAADGATSLTLLQRARGGDGDAWHRLVDLYTPLVYHWCRRWGLQAVDTDDVVQEVFLAASRSLDQFRKERAGDTFRGWLRGITRNKLLGFSRRRGSPADGQGGTEALLQLHALPDVVNGVDPPEDTEPVSALLRRVLEQIRGEFEPRSWQAFWQVAVDGRTPADVAADLGMSVNAIRMAKCRVLRRLREESGDLAG